jgi:heme oxygenase
MILAKLKEATKTQHEELETVVDIMNQMFSRADYRTLLGKFYRFYSAVEPKLPVAELAEVGLNFEARRKTPLLEKDLKELGVLERVRGTAEFAGVPGLDTVSKAFGSLYVMEGATLGGQLITRHLKQHLDITPETGGAFFNSYGAEVGPMWKQFGGVLTAYADHAGEDDVIVQSARDTFDSFRRCVEEANGYMSK